MFISPSWADKGWAEGGGECRMDKTSAIHTTFAYGEDSEAWSEVPDALQPDLPLASPSDQVGRGGEGDEGLAHIERWCDALVQCD